MKIKLRPVKSYMLVSQDDRDVALLTVESRWEGLIKLVTADGQVVVCEQPEAMREMMASAGVPWLGTIVEADALKMSTELLAQLAPQQKVVSDSRPTDRPDPLPRADVREQGAPTPRADGA